MLFDNFSYKRFYKYLACFLATAVIFLSMPFTSFAAFAVSLTASPALTDSDTQVMLEWNPVAGAMMYEILRGLDTIETINPDEVLEATTYTDTGLSPETSYTYELRAYLDEEMQSEIALTNNQATVATTKMIRPTELSSVYNINTQIVTLSWETASDAANGCVVRVGSETGPIVASVVGNPAKTITFTTAEVNPVIYVAISNDGAGGHFSNASDPITVTPVNPPAVSVVMTSGVAMVSWNSFEQISFFQLERSKWGGTSWGGWELAIASLSGAGTADSPASGGTYRYRLFAKSNGNYAGNSNASSNVVRPKAPTGVDCSIADGNLVVLVWNIDPSNESVLKVARKVSENSYSIIATLNKTATGYAHAVPVVLGTTYTYREYAWDSDTNVVSSTECSVIAEIPGAPANLTLAADSKSSVTLNWQDNSASEQEYIIERKTDSGSFSVIGTAAANDTSYADETIDEDHTYVYRVRASNTLGMSAYSNTISITVNDIVAPNALTATVVSATQTDLIWSYPGNGRYSTIIETKTGSSGAWSVISTVAAGVYTYSNSGLTANTQYFYRVRNSLGTGITTQSYPDNDAGIGVYTMLRGLSLDGEAASGGRIRLEWSGTSTGSDVIIERKMANGGFSVLATVNTFMDEWYDTTGLIPGASYTYRIKAKNSMNESAYASELTVENLYLETPSELTVGPDSNQALILTWEDNSDGETGFEIWRRVYNSGSFVLHDKVGPNITKYTDDSAQAGVQYYYRVRAYLNQGELYSGYTVSESAGLGIIDPPDDLQFKYVSDTGITLAWDDNSDDESGFRIERRIDTDGEWERIVTVSRNTETYKLTGLNPYVKYFFRIRAYKGTGSFDSFSNEIEVTTGAPKAPTNVSAGSISPFQARITWMDKSDNETGFKVLRAVVGGTNYTTAAFVGKDVTTYLDSGLSNNTLYSYKVASYNDSGTTESSPIEVITGTYVSFKDVAVGFWARDAILNLAGRGIIKGKTATSFMPNDIITRAEFTALMIRAFQLETAPVGSFADVKIGKWYYNEVMIAENLGIVNGDAENRFYPDRMITREEMAVIIVKTLNVAGKPLNAHGNSVLEKFWDRDLISPYSLSSIASVVGEGVMTGLPGNALAPKKTLTRAEAAAIIYRVIDR